MKTQSIIVQSAAAILGEAKGGITDMGEPRLVIEAPTGEWIGATFAAGIYADPVMHYAAFAEDMALSLDRARKARLAVSVLSTLSADMRAEVIAEVCGRYSTPRVSVRPARPPVAWHGQDIAGAEDLAGVVSDADLGL